MFWNLMRLWEINVGEVKEKGDKSVCEGMKKKYNKNGSCTSVMCLEKMQKNDTWKKIGRKRGVVKRKKKSKAKNVHVVKEVVV